MKKNDFLTELQDLLQTDTEIGATTDLSILDEWDSIAFMVLIAYFDREFAKKLTFEDLGSCKTPNDLIALAQGDIN